ncbi:glucuronate isomerase [Rhodothermus marinus]|uniref:glucuronate isomerase n=1 Tax=Rhodothermus marinus TaxID=29549 RepID=UPI0037C69E99
MEPLRLHPDRYFDPDPTVRRIARELYEEMRTFPLVCPHGHVDPAILATNEPFPEPTSLIIKPDHYIFRLLYSQGIPLEALGIPRRDGQPVETDPRKIWQIFAEHYYLFAGTPTGAWLDYEFAEVFEVPYKLDGESAQYVYDHILERLQSPEYRPRALFERFNIEILTTTDAATDTLEHHQAIRASGWPGRVAPCFRPDAVFKIARPDWHEYLQLLEQRCGFSIRSYEDFIRALENRRAFFKEMGAFATDHAVLVPRTHRLAPEQAEALFQKALRGEATEADQADFEAHLLMEMARMSLEDGLVMQIHAGAFYNHNTYIYERFGPDKGGDIPVQAEFTYNLRELLVTYGNDPRLTVIVFTLDESTYSRELAPLAGHYPALKIGPAWWFHDSIEGIMRYREWITETASIYNTAGFNDDTRAFCSIPARHDLARRIDANYLARLVARHIIDMSDARRMARAMAYDLVRKTYRIDQFIPAAA